MRPAICSALQHSGRDVSYWQIVRGVMDSKIKITPLNGCSTAGWTRYQWSTSWTDQQPRIRGGDTSHRHLEMRRFSFRLTGAASNGPLSRPFTDPCFSHDRRPRPSLSAQWGNLGGVISEGTFGRCLNCKQEINAKRLAAIPSVRYCITCQELTDGTNEEAGEKIVVPSQIQFM
jgi:hypothetical protein